MISYADKHWNPTWTADGGLYYPRNDTFGADAEKGKLTDADKSHFTSPRVNTLTGNALIGLARIDVKNGMYGMFNSPWSAAHFSEPFISHVEYRDADVSQAVFDPSRNALVAIIQPEKKAASKPSTTFSLGNIPTDQPMSISINGSVVATANGGHISIKDNGVKVNESGDNLTITAPFTRPINLLVQLDARSNVAVSSGHADKQ
jgi:hypothetical protein